MRKKLLLVLAMLVPLIGFSVEKQKTASVRWGTFNIRLKNTGDDKAGNDGISVAIALLATSRRTI